jgi:hypothetical protein
MYKKIDKKQYQKPKMKVQPLKAPVVLQQPTSIGICIEGSNC